MNDPTREEFEQFKQEIRQEIRERVTEEIKATKVIIVSEDALKPINEKLDQQSALLKKIETKQTEHGEILFKHSKSISTLETTIATKEHIDKRFDAIAEVQNKILDRLPKPPE